jgi:hypothetical protein
MNNNLDFTFSSNRIVLEAANGEGNLIKIITITWLVESKSFIEIDGIGRGLGRGGLTGFISI